MLWTQGVILLAIWASVGVAGIVSNIVVSVQTERLAHRNRLKAMGHYFSHVLTLPPSFHMAARSTHSGRLIKTMLSGSDGLFATWLVFFRDQLATLISALRAAGQFAAHAAAELAPVPDLDRAGGNIRHRHRVRDPPPRKPASAAWRAAIPALAGTAQDAPLANVMVVQAFTRPAAEARIFRDIAQQLIQQQFPVYWNWGGYW